MNRKQKSSLFIPSRVINKKFPKSLQIRKMFFEKVGCLKPAKNKQTFLTFYYNNWRDVFKNKVVACFDF